MSTGNVDRKIKDREMGLFIFLSSIFLPINYLRAMTGRLLTLLAALGISCGQLTAADFSQPDARAQPDLFVWTDTCKVYVVRDGEAALLVNLGDGSVLEDLSELGVKKVEWVLFTDHHREQNQGASKLEPWRECGTKVAAPAAERALNFRKMNVSLGDAFTIHGASFVRPPTLSIPLDRVFATNDTRVWRGREIACLDTRGSSPGGMTYLLRENGRSLAFSGDVMLDVSKMHTWFDTEWDYGFTAGIQALRQSVARLAELNLERLLPSHGPPGREVGGEGNQNRGLRQPARRWVCKASSRREFLRANPKNLRRSSLG